MNTCLSSLANNSGHEGLSPVRDTKSPVSTRENDQVSADHRAKLTEHLKKEEIHIKNICTHRIFGYKSPRGNSHRIRDHPSFLSWPTAIFIVAVGLVPAVLYGFHTIFTDIVRME